MINYNSKNWLEAIRHFRRSYVIRRTVRMVGLVGLFTTFLALLDWAFHHHPELVPLNLSIEIETSVFTLLGVFLSLLLVFRTNSAYDRWWEGRKQWGALINHTRGLAVLINGMTRKEDEVNRRFFARSISSYVLALSDHLRNNSNHDLILRYSDEQIDELRQLEHVPNKIVNDMWTRIETMYADGFIDGFQLTTLKPETQSFLDIQGACERIKATPIPFAHNFFIKLFILAYCFLVPFAMIPMVGFYSIPLSMFVAYALVGIEYISVEIEEPFGLDCNDLPTHNLALKIEKNVHEILAVELDRQENEQKEQYIVIS
ncbi:MAG: bestrophin family protein [Bacteroidota bacterium]